MRLLIIIWQVWKRIGQFLGDLIGRVGLTLFYFTFFLPFGVGVRLFSDPLGIRPTHKPGWSERTSYEMKIEEMRRLS